LDRLKKNRLDRLADGSEVTREEYEKWLEYSEDNVVSDGVMDEPDVSFEKYRKANLAELSAPREPLISKREWGHIDGISIVGQSEKTNEDCHRLVKIVACLDVGRHNFTGLDGHKHTGNGSFYPVLHSCNKATCRLCYPDFARREAKNIAARLEFAEKEFRKKGLDVGRIEHATISLCKADVDAIRFAPDKAKAVAEARRKAWAYALARGFAGGTLIWHPFRYADMAESIRKGIPFGRYFSGHFHLLGFIYGGYRCRNCAYNNNFSRDKCLSCREFEGRTRREFAKDGTIVKVFGKRKTVEGTAYYQLNHAGVVDDVERYHVATWAGLVSYRKMHFDAKKFVKKREHRCKICGGVMKHSKFCRSEEDKALLMLAIKSGVLNRGWEEPLVKNGVVQWEYAEDDSGVKWAGRGSCEDYWEEGDSGSYG
jgi:hypothetical protein